jgi:hypothetical protein
MSRDGMTGLRVWDVRTGVPLFSLRGHSKEVSTVAYSSDGSRIATGSHDGSAKVWDARNGEELLSLNAHGRGVGCVVLSPDGSRLVTHGSDVQRLFRLWDARAKGAPPVELGRGAALPSVAYSPDGKRIVAAAEGETVRVYEAGSGKELYVLAGRAGHKGQLMGLAISPDGSRVASVSSDTSLKLWDLSTGQELVTLAARFGTSGGYPHAVAFSPDGRGLTARSWTGAVICWDAPFDVGRSEAEHAEEAAIEEAIRCRKDREFHAEQAGRAEKTDAFACAFHLDRLLALSPDERPALLKRRAAVLSAALKADPNDHRSVRALARQAVADPGTLPDVKALLPLLARHPRAAQDRLYGALLLRTGDTRGAAVVLRAAARHRHDEAPVDELLLSLALTRLDRREEARQYLTKAVAWMDGAPQRAAALLGLRQVGPLAALGGAVAPAPDPRLNPLDPFTAHELHVLRREAEQALVAGR